MASVQQLLDAGAPARCVWCQTTPTGGGHLTVEHLLPRSRGGGSDAHNLALACSPCNSRRKSRAAASWFIEGVRRRGRAVDCTDLLAVLDTMSSSGSPAERRYAERQAHQLRGWQTQYERWGVY